MSNPFSKSMTNTIGNGGMQRIIQSDRGHENVQGSANQVQASVKGNQDNLKNILLQVVGNTCGLNWLNCPKNCFSVDKKTGCPSCSCKRPPSSNSKDGLLQQEATPCPLFPDDCPRGFSKIDENQCPICSLDEIASLSKDTSKSTANQKDGSSVHSLSWYDKMWSSSK
ncbi:unnamed protein product [Mytilus edulis]|uniref:Uncharacterized protein n=1 Tax=Mytilus edulis TaxID=6550 RepID=A0A8S3QR77_MYTED|nr:unnamed protein product [Mytilus edulis]